MDNNRLALLKVVGAVVFGVILVVATVFMFLGYRAKSSAQKDIDEFVKNAAIVADIQYANVSANALDGYVTVTDIRVSPNTKAAEPITIDKIQYRYELGPDKSYITRLNLKVTGLKTKLKFNKMPPEVSEALRAMKLQDLNTNFDLDFHYKPDEKALLFKLQQDYIGLGKIGFGMMLSNVDPNLAKNPMLSDAITLKQLHFEYTDERLVKNIIMAIAASQSMTPDQLIQSIEPKMEMAMAKNNDVKAKEIMQKILLFLKDPKKIVFESKPIPPLVISEIKFIPPDQVIERLGINVFVVQ